METMKKKTRLIGNIIIDRKIVFHPTGMILPRGTCEPKEKRSSRIPALPKKLVRGERDRLMCGHGEHEIRIEREPRQIESDELSTTFALGRIRGTPASQR